MAFLQASMIVRRHLLPVTIANPGPSSTLKLDQKPAACSGFLKDGERSMTQAALRFALQERAVSTVIAGMKTPDHVVENAGVSDLKPISREDLLRVRELQLRGFNKAPRSQPYLLVNILSLDPPTL